MTQFFNVQILLLGVLLLFCATDSVYSADKSIANGFQGFVNIYEPSGIEQLPDGRFIVVEDESDFALSVVCFESNGQVTEQRLQTTGKLADLEGITQGKNGFIYAITSHAKTKKGKRSRNREQLIRFRLNSANQVTDISVNRSLRDAIGQKLPSLKNGNTKFDDDLSFNIEGLSFDANKNNLLIGIRSPVEGKKSVIVVLKNPNSLFDGNQKLPISDKLILLNLKGGGIRSITYDAHLQGYLIASRKPGNSFKLWFWNGKHKSKPRPVKIHGLKKLRHLEGITSAKLPNGKTGIVLVSDDGNASKNRPGHFVFINYEQLVFND
ncbi:MAG: hypothetical protein ISEC1_P0740 [Thiomicrorhabdus sp.]|nr:MAG: hypothetical protein ISEC1_P0740 [Thiomicrorhabdus sp.]